MTFSDIDRVVKLVLIDVKTTAYPTCFFHLLLFIEPHANILFYSSSISKKERNGLLTKQIGNGTLVPSKSNQSNRICRFPAQINPYHFTNIENLQVYLRLNLFLDSSFSFL